MQYPSDDEGFSPEDGGSQPSPEEYELCKQYFEESYALFLDFFSNLDTNLQWVVDDIHDYKEQDVMLESLLEMIIDLFGGKIYSEFVHNAIYKVLAQNPNLLAMHLLSSEVDEILKLYHEMLSTANSVDPFYRATYNPVPRLAPIVIYKLNRAMDRFDSTRKYSQGAMAYKSNAEIIVNNIAGVFYPGNY